MPIDAILSALVKVKSVGAGRYRACCPVHSGTNANLSIKECDNGDVVMHCFKCGANGLAVVDSLGVSRDELFYERRPENDVRYFSETEINEIELQIWFCVHARSDISKGMRLSPQDFDKYRACLYNLTKEYGALRESGRGAIADKIDTVKMLIKINNIAFRQIDGSKLCQKLSVSGVNL